MEQITESQVWAISEKWVLVDEDTWVEREENDLKLMRGDDIVKTLVINA